MKTQQKTIVWFRQDLRTEDHPALTAAAERGEVIPLYIIESVNTGESEGEADGEGGSEGGGESADTGGSAGRADPWLPGAASQWWLSRALERLAASLKSLQLPLTIHQGDPLAILGAVVAESGATALFWSRRYEPAALQRDTRIKAHFSEQGLLVKSFNSSLLFEPWTIATQQGKPYQVFTPFWKACLALGPPSPPLPVPSIQPNKDQQSTRGSTHTTHPTPCPPPLSWEQIQTTLRDPILRLHAQLHARLPGGTTPLPSFEQLWGEPETTTAAQLLDAFTRNTEKCRLAAYGTARDFPAIDGVSLLSPFLHYGEISPRMIWHHITTLCSDPHPSLSTGNLSLEAASIYLRQLGWREFAHHLLYHFPSTPEHPLRRQFDAFPWRHNEAHLEAWKRGMTGYPFVDAGMRQLLQTGWMHNRVRMVVGSFLVKDLLIAWQEGARWFWETLVDADLANNTLGWQWVAGCGADAAPYFRVFNPITQGEKFDASGEYVRQWVPELARLPDQWIQRPWEAPEGVLANAGVQLGTTYPHPIVNHAEARLAALRALKEIQV